MEDLNASSCRDEMKLDQLHRGRPVDGQVSPDKECHASNKGLPSHFQLLLFFFFIRYSEGDKSATIREFMSGEGLELPSSESRLTSLSYALL